MTSKSIPAVLGFKIRTAKGKTIVYVALTNDTRAHHVWQVVFLAVQRFLIYMLFSIYRTPAFHVN